MCKIQSKFSVLSPLERGISDKKYLAPEETFVFRETAPQDYSTIRKIDSLWHEKISLPCAYTPKIDNLKVLYADSLLKELKILLSRDFFSNVMCSLNENYFISSVHPFLEVLPDFSLNIGDGETLFAFMDVDSHESISELPIITEFHRHIAQHTMLVVNTSKVFFIQKTLGRIFVFIEHKNPSYQSFLIKRLLFFWGCVERSRANHPCLSDKFSSLYVPDMEIENEPNLAII